MSVVLHRVVTCLFEELAQVFEACVSRQRLAIGEQEERLWMSTCVGSPVAEVGGHRSIGTE